MRFIITAGLVMIATPALGRDAAVDLVDPLAGTLADFGQLTPAAVAPFGMVQLGPDTNPANHAGYDFAADRLNGFSFTRGVGVGCGGGGGDLLVSMRFAGASGPALMDKRRERSAAGFYRIVYDGAVTAEATATRGAGLLRFSTKRAGRVQLRIDARHSYAKRASATWRTVNSDDLRAEMVAGTVCDKGLYRLFSSSRVTVNDRPLHRNMVAKDGVATLDLDLERGDVVQLATGLSSVDVDGAARVRETELGSRPFKAVAAATRANWNRVLERVRPEGGRAERALFYTSLFRVFQTPVAIDDPDGRHRENDGSIARSSKGQTRYASWSLWDNYRTQLPLLALLQPERSQDIARSLADLYIRGKAQWATMHEPFLTVRTEHAGIALLDMRRKGITGFDAPGALKAMVADSATLQRDTPDQQIEAAYDDWATAQLARDLGDEATARRFTAQAIGYRPMWLSVFEKPGEDGDIVKARGLYQGTLWQYRWAPVFDLEWMMATVGNGDWRAQLHRFFNDGLFNMTNEPDIHVPWLFAAAGESQATADLIRKILTQPMEHPYTNEGKLARPFVGYSFALAPQGFADGMDDDAGAMTAWYVFASLGLYPLVPGEPWYQVTVPAFSRTTMDLGQGRRVTVRRAGPRDGKIVQVDWNGRVLTDWRVGHDALVKGGVLTVTTQPH